MSAIGIQCSYSCAFCTTTAKEKRKTTPASSASRNPTNQESNMNRVFKLDQVKWEEDERADKGGEEDKDKEENEDEGDDEEDMEEEDDENKPDLPPPTVYSFVTFFSEIKNGFCGDSRVENELLRKL